MAGKGGIPSAGGAIYAVIIVIFVISGVIAGLSLHFLIEIRKLFAAKNYAEARTKAIYGIVANGLAWFLILVALGLALVFGGEFILGGEELEGAEQELKMGQKLLQNALSSQQESELAKAGRRTKYAFLTFAVIMFLELFVNFALFIVITVQFDRKQYEGVQKYVDITFYLLIGIMATFVLALFIILGLAIAAKSKKAKLQKKYEQAAAAEELTPVLQQEHVQEVQNASTWTQALLGNLSNIDVNSALSSIATILQSAK